jgi:uracil-DNA glycosylase family 4
VPAVRTRPLAHQICPRRRSRRRRNHVQQGRPFVGAAGHFLEQLLASIGLTRGDVYICNVIKCRPPGNRDPLPDEIQACADYLEQQISRINPRLIVTLGRYSMAKYFPQASISRIHGQAQRISGVLVLPMYHPAAALHQPRYRTDIEADFKKIPAVLKQTTAPEEMPTSEGPTGVEQLSLF